MLDKRLWKSHVLHNKIVYELRWIKENSFYLLQEKLLHKSFGKLHWILNLLIDFLKARVKLFICYFKIDIQLRDVVHLSKSLLETANDAASKNNEPAKARIT